MQGAIQVLGFTFLLIDCGVTLLHQRADTEPEAVDERELVLDNIAMSVARMRVVPLVRTEASEYEQRQTHHHVRRQHVDPHLQQSCFR